MATQKKGITTYKRDKDKMEISGENKDIKLPIMIDQLSRILRWLMIGAIISMVVYVIKDNPGTDILKYIKVLLPFLSLFVAMTDYMQMFLSG